jgi:hypothetical protein
MRTWKQMKHVAALIPICLLVVCSSACAGEVVQFRLAKARTIEINNEATAVATAKSLKQLGCPHRLDGHAGHYHLTIQCPTWRQSEFPNHEVAHQWMDWLGSLGFETRH